MLITIDPPALQNSQRSSCRIRGRTRCLGIDWAGPRAWSTLPGVTGAVLVSGDRAGYTMVLSDYFHRQGLGRLSRTLIRASEETLQLSLQHGQSNRKC
jgi:hypothetical protein